MSRYIMLQVDIENQQMVIHSLQMNFGEKINGITKINKPLYFTVLIPNYIKNLECST